MVRGGATKSCLIGKLARHNTTKYVVKLLFNCVVLGRYNKKFFLN